MYAQYIEYILGWGFTFDWIFNYEFVGAVFVGPFIATLGIGKQSNDFPNIRFYQSVWNVPDGLIRSVQILCQATDNVNIHVCTKFQF